MKETLSTMAERLGYSATTISRVLSGKAEKYRISPDTVDAVLREARRCNYSPSVAAQSLRTRRSNTIGLLLPSVANPYFADMASVIITELNSAGYTTIVVDTMESEQRLSESARSLISRQVDGILAVPCGEKGMDLEMLSAQIPVVLIDRYYEDTSLPYVTTNNYQGGLDATRHLLSRGHTRISCIQGVQSSMPNKERVRGYVKAMEDEGLAQDIDIIGNEFSVQNGYLETKLLMSRAQRPTAIFALSNTIMLGALKAIREAGLRIPEDVALISFDNNLYMDYMTPSITRISQPVEDMAKLAVKILLDKIKGASNCGSQLRLSPIMVAGESA
ncbi:MAG: LacI family DNA-binding transcriptional regulator [Candidatus Cryptobacteroides sp.]